MAPHRRIVTLALTACLALVASLASAAPALPKLVRGGGERVAGQLVVGSDGAEYELPGGARLSATAGAKLRVFLSSQRLVLRGGHRVTTWSVLLHHGRLTISVPSVDPPKMAVMVTGPRRVGAIVSRGRLEASVDGPRIALANIDGEVLAGGGSTWNSLGVGQVFGIRERKAGLERWPRIQPPSNIQAPKLMTALSGATSIEALHWSAVKGAESYRVEVRRVGADAAQVAPVAVAETQEPRLERAVGPLAAGRYTVSVRSVDAMGLRSVGASTRLRVLGVALPDGAYLSQGGAVLLGRGQKVRFTHVDGLEMTYRGSGHFYPASSRVGLYRNEPTVVLFRVAGAADVVTARLEPRTLYAKVRIGPKNAVWPRDRIAIRIQLGDRRGRAVPEWVDIVPKVTLGIDPVQVEWKRQGNTLLGHVDPRWDSRGPWVLRVDVRDQFGLPLGRNFLEIVDVVPRHRRASRR